MGESEKERVGKKGEKERVKGIEKKRVYELWVSEKGCKKEE